MHLFSFAWPDFPVPRFPVEETRRRGDNAMPLYLRFFSLKYHGKSPTLEVRTILVSVGLLTTPAVKIMKVFQFIVHTSLPYCKISHT